MINSKWTRWMILFALVAAIGVSRGLTQNLPPKPEERASYPRGCYAMWPAGKPIPSEILDNPGLVGVYLQFVWSDVETHPGTYDWSKLDARLLEAERAGMAVVLSIRADLTHAAKWIHDSPHVGKVSLVATNKYQKTFGQTGHYPLFWDPIYLEAKSKFIAALGHRYSGRTHVVAVTTAFANIATDDWGVPHEDAATLLQLCNVAYDNERAWIDAGYSVEKMEMAGRRTMDVTAKAFPAQCLKLPIGNHGKPLQAAELLHRIIDYGRKTYGDRFFVQVSRMDNGVSPADDPAVANSADYSRFGLYRIVRELAPQCGLQMYGAATLGDRDGCRQNHNQHPCPPGPVLSRSLNLAISYRPTFVEVWPDDSVNPDLAQLYAPATLKMGGTLRRIR